jgi:hypothetical protein
VGEAADAVVLPDGCVDVIWQQDRGAFVAGVDTGPVATALQAGVVFVGVRFSPGAAGAALRVAMHELRDRRVEVAELDPALARRLAAGLPPRALARIASLAEELVVAVPPHHLVQHATALLTRPETRVAEVERAVGLGQRQLRRRTASHSSKRCKAARNQRHVDVSL